VIGNLSRDVVEGAPPRVGGAPFYAARALHVIGLPARVLAKCAAADRAPLLTPLVAQGVPVAWQPAARTAAFSFSYDGDRRTMTVDALGDPWTPAEARGWVAAALAGTRWVHVGALARSDFPAETLSELAHGRRLSLDGQALVRPPRTGPLVPDADFDPAVLEHVAVLKLAEEEARLLAGDDFADELRGLGVPEIVVTLGARGSLVLAGGSAERVPTPPVPGRVDPTGAGDAFAAAYVSGRNAGHAPAAAARRASALVAALLVGRAA
jgi:sugar/nucleoside kinase (ribokinase family)